MVRSSSACAKAPVASAPAARSSAHIANARRASSMTAVVGAAGVAGAVSDARFDEGLGRVPVDRTREAGSFELPRGPPLDELLDAVDDAPDREVVGALALGARLGATVLAGDRGEVAGMLDAPAGIAEPGALV